MLGSGMMFGLLLRRFFHLLRRPDMMRLREVRVVPSLFLFTSAVSVRSCPMLLCRLLMLFCGFAMMLYCRMFCH